ADGPPSPICVLIGLWKDRHAVREVPAEQPAGRFGLCSRSGRRHALQPRQTECSARPHQERSATEVPRFLCHACSPKVSVKRAIYGGMDQTEQSDESTRGAENRSS